MILNMNLAKIFKSYILGSSMMEEENTTKNRLNGYLSHIQKSLNSKLLVILNIGIMFQSILLMMQSNQRINLSTLMAMAIHYSI